MHASDWFFRRALMTPDRPAVVDATGRPPRAGAQVRSDGTPVYTYRALAERGLRLAARLAAVGVEPGDRVAMLARNRIEYLDVLLACARLGTVFVPLNWRLAPAEIGQIVADAAPRLVLHDEEGEPARAAAALDVETLPLGEAYEAALDRADPGAARGPAAGVGLEDPWMLLYTGGTTGRSKGAVISHRQVIWNALNTAVSWELLPTDRAPVFTPMFHTGGLHVFLTPLLHRGGTVVLADAFDPERALDLIQRERLTLVFMVPTMYHMLTEQTAFAHADFGHVRWFISGGAPCPEPVYRAFRERGLVFKEGYGLTEVGPNNFVLPVADVARKPGSVGIPVLHAAVRLVDENGRDCGPGAVGEVLLAGPHVCSGYWRNPEASAQVLRDGWFHTGDLARRDEEGYYWIVGRKKDLIITGGENVYPLEVETVLQGHPAVAEAAVVGVPDPKWGERVKAVVVLRPGRQVTAAELERYCRRRLAGYKIPRIIEFRRELPRNAAGKVLKRALIEPGGGPGEGGAAS